MLKNRFWIPVTASVVFVLVLPAVLSLVRLPQALTVKGTYVKNNNRVLDRFLSGIREENGVLVLGTSETAYKFDSCNYWGFLNADKSTDLKFSVLSGAGRTSSVYFPLLLKDPKKFQNLNILYYVNPTYWREYLSEFDTHYYENYAGKELVLGIIKEAKKRGLYRQFIKPAVYDSIGIDSISINEFKDLSFQIVDNFRSYFYYDLVRLIQDNAKIRGKDKLLDTLTGKMYEEFVRDIDLQTNVTTEYLQRNADFPSIDKNTRFRYDELYAFINLCKNNDIRITFYLGPYNTVYAQHKNPELINDYQEVVREIREIIIGAELPLIDGSDISNIPGTFIDVQHISKYGAWLTAQKIKKYYEKK
jgi:hypothetical protein